MTVTEKSGRDFTVPSYRGLSLLAPKVFDGIRVMFCCLDILKPEASCMIASAAVTFNPADIQHQEVQVLQRSAAFCRCCSLLKAPCLQHHCCNSSSCVLFITHKLDARHSMQQRLLNT